MNFPALVSHMKGLVARINYRDKFWHCLHEGCSCGDSMIGFLVDLDLDVRTRPTNREKPNPLN